LIEQQLNIPYISETAKFIIHSSHFHVIIISYPVKIYLYSRLITYTHCNFYVRQQVLL